VGASFTSAALIYKLGLEKLLLRRFAAAPHTQKMAESTKEESKGDGVLSTSWRKGDVFVFDDVEKRPIWRTLDIHLLPFVSLLYLMSFL
jgi:hypothetical protein